MEIENIIFVVELIKQYFNKENITCPLSFEDILHVLQYGNIERYNDLFYTLRTYKESAKALKNLIEGQTTIDDFIKEDN